MPRVRQRAAAADDPAQTQRRRRNDTSDDDDDDVDVEETQDSRGSGSGSLEQLSKGLIRYALSCEFSRKPIKRPDINEKVLGSHSRQFKEVFERANLELMDVFGMRMVELPKADRVTARQKRAAAASESQSKMTAIWVLQTILPELYRIPEIIGPSRTLPDDEADREASYVGLYTMVIALIIISGGMMAEGKLDRALRRMNADRSTVLGTKDKTLALMIKDGYIVRVKDSSSGEETVDYIVGPRGKVEVGREGFRDFVSTMYGSDEDADELSKRIERTLNVAEAFDSSAAPSEAAPVASQTGRKRGRPRREDEDD